MKDVKAGLTDEQIQSFFNEREFFPEELMDPKRFYNSVREIARLSTSGAPVAPSSEAAVTAEPVASIDTHEFRRLCANIRNAAWRFDGTQPDVDALVAHIDRHIATHSAPARQAESLQTRDAKGGE